MFKISDKQLEANRQNAQQSTGPRSLEGKNTSRRNAMRHGFSSQVVVMIDADREAFDKFMYAYIADLSPSGPQQEHLAQSIANDAWRLNRIRAVEDNIFATGAGKSGPRLQYDHPEIHSAMVQAFTFWNDPHKFSLLSTYERRLLGNFHKNIALYRELGEAAPAKPRTMAAGAAES